MKRIMLFFTVVLLAVLCCACGTLETNQGKETSGTDFVQLAIPESATEIISNIGVEVNLDSDVPIISMYDYSDDTATAIYTYLYLLSKLTEGQDDCKIVIHSGDETIDTSSLEEKNAKSVEEVSMPTAWLEFATERGIGNGKVTISDFVSKETANQIEEKIQQNVFDVISDHYSAASTEESSQNTLLSENYTLEGNEIKFHLFEDDGKHYLWIDDITNNEEHASLFIAYFLGVFSKMSDNNIESYTITCTCNEKLASLMLIGDQKVIAGTNSDGSTVTGSFPDWIITNMEDFKTPQNELEAFLLELQGIVNEFMEKLE